ncbi:MAG: hypothetical protein QM762_19365 [Chryseolinea sp.]
MRLSVIVIGAAAAIAFSCVNDVGPIFSRGDEGSSNNHTISLIIEKGEAQANESNQVILFSYEKEVLTSTRSVQSTQEYKYDNARLQQIKYSNYPYYTVSFDYNTDGSVVVVSWAGVGRTNGYDTFKYADGKLDSVISRWKWLTETSVSKSKVHWNGDNIESKITRSECMCGGLVVPFLSIDTVTYQYSDGLNPFSSSKYAGYTESLGASEKIPFASKNTLVKFNQVGTSYRYDSDHVLVDEARWSNHRELTYVFDNEYYPVEIREEVTSHNGEKSVSKTEIRY